MDRLECERCHRLLALIGTRTALSGSASLQIKCSHCRYLTTFTAVSEASNPAAEASITESKVSRAADTDHWEPTA